MLVEYQMQRPGRSIASIQSSKGPRNKMLRAHRNGPTGNRGLNLSQGGWAVAVCEPQVLSPLSQAFLQGQ